MITHAEFRRAYWRHWIGHLVRVVGLLGIGTAAFAAVWLILEVVDRRDPTEIRAEAAVAVAIVVTIAAIVQSAWSAEERAREDPRLICPHCDRPLGSYEGYLVLSSGNCPHCGEQVLEG